MHKAIRKQARKDKKEWLASQLEHSAQCVSAKDKWEWIKRLKKGYTAKALALKDKEGKLVNTLKQADTFAEYLRDSRWTAPQHPYTESTSPIHTDTD